MPYVFPIPKDFSTQGIEKVDPEIYETVKIIRDTQRHDDSAAAAVPGSSDEIRIADDWSAGIGKLKTRSPKYAVILATAGKQSDSAVIRARAEAELKEMAKPLLANKQPPANPGKIGNHELDRLRRPAGFAKSFTHS
jgi:hypothetical protein